MSAADLENSILISGSGVPVAEPLEGGEVFDLGDGLELEVVYAPGHSTGNICILDRKNKVLAQGETAAGVAQYDVEGRLLTTPYYEDVEVYLRTLAVVARLDFETMVPSHLAVMDRVQAAHFLEDSLDFALRFEQEVQQRVRNGRPGLTSLELLRSMDGLWGQYPADLGMYMLLESHLSGLLKRGLVQGSLATGLAWAGAAEDDLAPLAQEARTAIQGMVPRAGWLRPAEFKSEP
jgi:glyoxylase-like metal-dependent hydrolase (beta-lactamase superfamily II)